MKTSNIFAYIELSKLVDQISPCSDGSQLKETLKTQAAYFNIIENRYFSETLEADWESIQTLVGVRKEKVKAQDKVVVKASKSTIDDLSTDQCIYIADRIHSIFNRVSQELG